MPDTFPQTARTTANRHLDRVGYDAATARAVLDEAYHCHLGFVVDGEPRVLPTLHVRIDDTVYVHGSTGSRPLLAARSAAGLPVCLAVTLLDGLVLARSQFHHSANYRSVVVHGNARLVTDEAAKREVLTALVEKVGRGRAGQTRPPNRRELAETAVLALPLAEVSVKARSGPVADEPEDYDLPHWAGVVPLRLMAGAPEPDAGVTAPTPDHLRPGGSPWLVAEPMRGDRVVLEPLDLSHVDGLFAATRDPQVWRWLAAPAPASAEDMRGYVVGALREHAQGARVPWALRDARTGEVAGTTSFYQVDEVNRSVTIGHTMIGSPWWGTGLNTDAKLLLLRRAFDGLGAVRVVWRTDVGNERSLAALDRIGARREGVLRASTRLPDGTVRDAVQYAMTAQDWPEAQQRLAARLRPR
ncbi:MAG TPA: bifunctional pyridoxamine 5'-phosphate oxidase family protein/GNAT family N-acetyltransferase [Micromonosporaceae bacterium]|nr:bifunctional pyridoxamine 5'-phosphate oxidase family protein/GNAT family N-acetyltransferase [Micromonosporaceae bacterium]